MNHIVKKKDSLKYFIGYYDDDDDDDDDDGDDDDVIKPMCIRCLQKIGYVKHFDSNKKGQQNIGKSQ